MNGKKHMLKAIALLLAICSIAVMFTGCSNGDALNNAYRTVEGNIPDTQLLASNSKYELHWDADGKAILYKSKDNGQYWSDILYDAFLEGSYSANGNSPISITVADSKTLKWDTITSYAALEESGSVVCKKIDNGIRVTYFFDNYKIAIPVDYTLREDCLNVSIDGSKILEDGDVYQLVSVSVTPLLCSVSTATEGGYLFVPSASGALMYTKETPEGARKFTGEIYGTDGARQIPNKLSDFEEIRLPVFGSAGGGKALLGIIEEGAGAASIEALAGNPKLNNSNIGAVFYFRGYDSFEYERYGKPAGINERITDDIAQQKMSVSYYPLFGEDANYNGMAKRYREYLLEKDLLKKTDINESSYGVTLLGGTNITKSILGIPKIDTVALTTFNEADEIISSLKNDTSVAPYVRMLGYGDNGINSGTIGGGKKYISEYGTKKDLANLFENNSDTRIYMDYDILTYAKSGAGFSLGSDVAKTAIMYKAERFKFSPTRLKVEENPYYLIGRKKLPETLELAIKKAKKYGNKFVSFSSLGSIAYSDYNDSKYTNKNEMNKDVANLIKTAQKNGFSVAVADANDYAAYSTDVMFDIPYKSALYSAFDQEIPFYQMVFHSYKPMYSDAINLDENPELAVAKAAAYGMGLGYTLTYSYQEQSNDLSEYGLYGTVYEDNAELIKQVVFEKGYNKLYSATSDAELMKYTLLSSGVTESEFSNGVTVYVNLTANKVQSPVGELGPYEFKMK